MKNFFMPLLKALSAMILSEQACALVKASGIIVSVFEMGERII